MKKVSSLTTCLAGCLLSSTAFSADLPVKAKAVEYVKVCSAYGAGYYYVPGTDTCLKLGGYARFDTYVNAVGTLNPAISSAGAIMFNGPGAGTAGFPLVTNDSPDYMTRARAVLDADARTATDYGVLRSYVRFGGQYDSQAQAGATAGASFYFERAFIQFAGFTFGYTQSFFDTGVNYMITQPYAGSNTWTTAAAYTAQFGNGFSATIALEDAANRTTGVQLFAAGLTSNTLSATGYGYTNYQDGQSAPDIVANIRLDQAWGTAMISGALHQVAALTPIGQGTAYIGQNSSDTWGWAIGGSLELKLPVLSPGDSLYLQGNYADGAINYAGLSGSSTGRATGLGSVDVGNALNQLSGAFYPIADAIWTGTGFSTEVAWSVVGQFRHYWVPNIRSAVFGGYSSVEVPQNNLNAQDVNIWQVGANTIWSPVKNLDLGVEVVYSKVDGGAPFTMVGGSPTSLPTQVYGGSTDVWAGGFRAQRNF